MKIDEREWEKEREREIVGGIKRRYCLEKEKIINSLSILWLWWITRMKNQAIDNYKGPSFWIEAIATDYFFPSECARPLRTVTIRTSNSETEKVFFRDVSRVADPDPVGSGFFAWIRIRFSNFSGSGSWSGFSPESGTEKNCRKVSKSDLSEENLKFMTKDRQKMKKATISY